MSSCNCCFLTCIQISQDIGQVVWYSHLFQNFPQFVVIHTVKGFGIANKAEVDVFLELAHFFDDSTDVGIWSLVPLSFLNPIWTSENSQFTYCQSLAWRILSITLLACEMSAIILSIVWAYIYAHIYKLSSLSILWHCLSLGLEWKQPFSVLWSLLSFPHLLVYWVQHFHSITF